MPLAEAGLGRIWRLIQHLPDDARFYAAVAEDSPDAARAAPDVATWPRTDRLLASVVDELAIANWQRAGGKKNKRPELLTAPKRRRRVTPSRAEWKMTPQQVWAALGPLADKEMPR